MVPKRLSGHSLLEEREAGAPQEPGPVCALQEGNVGPSAWPCSQSRQTPSAPFPLIPQIPRLTRGLSLTLYQTLRDHHLTHHLCQLCGPGCVPAHAGGRQQRSEPRPGKSGLPFLLPACRPGCALVDDTGAAAPKDTDPTSPPPAGLAEGLRALQGNLAGLGSMISVLCQGRCAELLAPVSHVLLPMAPKLGSFDRCGN